LLLIGRVELIESSNKIDKLVFNNGIKETIFFPSYNSSLSTKILLFDFKKNDGFFVKFFTPEQIKDKVYYLFANKTSFSYNVKYVSTFSR